MVPGVRTGATGSAAAAGGGQGLVVIPREPVYWLQLDGLGVALERPEGIERVDLVEGAGVDQAHVDVPDLRAAKGFVAQGVFPVIESFR